jgi:hypothetical protein
MSSALHTHCGHLQEGPTGGSGGGVEGGGGGGEDEDRRCVSQFTCTSSCAANGPQEGPTGGGGGGVNQPCMVHKQLRSLWTAGTRECSRMQERLSRGLSEGGGGVWGRGGASAAAVRHVHQTPVHETVFSMTAQSPLTCSGSGLSSSDARQDTKVKGGESGCIGGGGGEGW